MSCVNNFCLYSTHFMMTYSSNIHEMYIRAKALKSEKALGSEKALESEKDHKQPLMLMSLLIIIVLLMLSFK